VRPYIISQIKDKYGEPIKKSSPQASRQVITPAVAQRVKRILVGVIEEGTGKLANVPGYSTGGKTGTAQKVEPNGTYSQSKFVASFIGFAPAENPVLAVAVTIDEPRGNHFGGVVAAPVFKNVCADVLRYLNIRQDRSTEVATSNEALAID
jgi:cell division protein FtsI/penicillin-binding protein 2